MRNQLAQLAVSILLFAGCGAASLRNSDGGGGQPGATGSGGGPSGGGGGGHGGGGTGGAEAARDGGSTSDASPGCPSGTHNCAGMGCVDDLAPAHCGGMCAPCVPPTGGAATCGQVDGGAACSFTCGTLKKCGSACVSGCCADTDCPPQGGKTGQCDTSTNTCSYNNCQTGYKPCGTSCIPSASCCSASDCAVCQSCASGTCTAVTNQDDPMVSRCAGTCDANGACKSKQGQTCNTTAGLCIAGTTCSPDGYCCNTACAGACVACDVPGYQGTCQNIAQGGSAHSNHPTCSGAGTACGAACDGMGACVFPTFACGAGPTCTSGGYVGQSTCMTGVCTTPAPQSCAGKLVCSVNACKSSCSADTDCVAGYYCNTGACQPGTADGTQCTRAAQCASNVCTSFYLDGDGDHYGAGSAVGFCGTTAPAGYAAQNGDCCDSNALMNPGADFQTTIGNCNGTTTWDYNCDGTIEPQKTGTVSIPNGCAPGSSCASCISSPNVLQVITQTCGAWTTGIVCANACPSPPAPGCVNMTVDIIQEACR